MPRLRQSDSYWVKLVNRVKGTGHGLTMTGSVQMKDMFMCNQCFCPVLHQARTAHKDWHASMAELAKHVARRENPELAFEGDPLRVDREG